MMTADVGVAIFKIPRRAVPADGQVLKRLNPRGGKCGGFDMGITGTSERRVQDTLVCDCFINADSSHREPDPVLVVPLCFNQRTPSSGIGSGNDKQVMFACFSPQPIILRSVRISAEAYRDALIEHTKKNGTKARLIEGASLYKSTEAGLTIYIENASMETLLFETNLSELFNMTISRGIQATNDGDQYLIAQDTVPPMHGMVIFVAAAMPAGHRYQFAPKVDIERGGRDIHQPPLTPCDALHMPFLLEGIPPPAGSFPAGQRLQQQRAGMWPGSRR